MLGKTFLFYIFYSCMDLQRKISNLVNYIYTNNCEEIHFKNQCKNRVISNRNL